MVRILIVGAGIAGLSLARALEQRGIIPDVVERQTTWNTGGTGLFLPGNASRAFSHLGLLPDIARVAMPIRYQRFLSQDGHELNAINTERFWSACGPCLALSRAEMHSILLSGVKQTPIAMSRSIDQIQSASDACEVTFEDGKTERYDLVVGADGIRSRVRDLAFASLTSVYAGYICWRFLTENTGGVDSWTAMIGQGQTLLAIPVSPSMAYVYADRSVELGATRPYSDTTSLERLFSGFSGPLVSLVKTVPPETKVHFSQIETVPSGTWRRDRIILIGDAAHASSPSMAEGAGLACEDALVLAELLSKNGAINLALEVFVQRRERRVAWVQKQCAARDRMRTLPAFVSSPLLKYFGPALYKKSYTPLLASI
ncbi:FAD-dependent monooxygenase [Microvirga sp. VF16]|uniref:FAD-dependent monooxygenase n=1 Tax=Microvirga sp. VF16 TaxID=2807101 RepID=UPI00193CBEA3|nr:FAD-dependent monooxygenase [Microvirga sp. VF16]QRM33433.1 FAD-dependent monooxygenase [Microvirga sp. VF16]